MNAFKDSLPREFTDMWDQVTADILHRFNQAPGHHVDNDVVADQVDDVQPHNVVENAADEDLIEELLLTLQNCQQHVANPYQSVDSFANEMINCAEAILEVYARLFPNGQEEIGLQARSLHDFIKQKLMLCTGSCISTQLARRFPDGYEHASFSDILKAAQFTEEIERLYEDACRS